MVKLQNGFNGYVCVPYLHNHSSIELKDLWVNSRNIDSLFFVTATFSEDSKPYFSSPVNHFILAKFKNNQKIQKDFSNNIDNNQSYEDFLNQGNLEDFKSDLRLEDEWFPISLSYTSGTTGDPKGVVTHHRGAYLNAISNHLIISPILFIS